MKRTKAKAAAELVQRTDWERDKRELAENILADFLDLGGPLDVACYVRTMARTYTELQPELLPPWADRDRAGEYVRGLLPSEAVYIADALERAGAMLGDQQLALF